MEETIQIRELNMVSSWIALWRLDIWFPTRPKIEELCPWSWCEDRGCIPSASSLIAKDIASWRDSRIENTRNMVLEAAVGKKYPPRKFPSMPPTAEAMKA